MTVLEAKTTVVHVVGPPDDDGFQRCLSCDEIIPGHWRDWSYVEIAGVDPPKLIPAARRRSAPVRKSRCSVRSWR